MFIARLFNLSILSLTFDKSIKLIEFFAGPKTKPIICYIMMKTSFYNLDSNWQSFIFTCSHVPSHKRKEEK